MTPEQLAAIRKAEQRAAIQRAQAAAGYDGMGFPAQPQGGSRTNPGAVDDFQQKGRAALVGAADGMSLGFSDEIRGAYEGGLTAVMGNGFSDAYAQGRDRVRQGQRELQQQEPAAYGGGQMVGAMAPAAFTMGAATAPTTLGTMGRGAMIGAAEGGLYGFGSGEGFGDRVVRGGVGAVVGAGVGLAVPAAIRGGVAAKNAVLDPVTGIADGMMNRANKTKTSRAIMEALRASRQSPDDVIRSVLKAAQQGQPEFRVMDALGVPGQRQASGVARAGGDASTAISDFLTSRQAGQADRVGGFIDDAFGTTGTTAAKTTDSLKTARTAAANSAYDAARGNAAPVDIRGALDVIDSRIGGMQGSGVAGDGIDGKLAGYRNRLAAEPGPDGVMRELSDFDRVLGVKQSIQDDIGAAVRAGRNNEARELGKLVQELDGALEGASDMYRTANDGFRDASRVIDAVDQGADMSKRGRAADNVPAFQRMNPDQQGAARIGYGDDLLRRVEGATAPTSNKAKVLQSPKRDAEAAAMTIDPQMYADRLARENTMWETQNRALGGSRTADNLQDISQTGEIAGGVADVARAGANFQFGDAVAKIGGMLGPLAKGQNEATREMIARALMSNDPVKTLAPMIRKEGGSALQRRMIEALLRNGTREPIAAPFRPQ